MKSCAAFCAGIVALVLLTMYSIDPRHLMLLAILLIAAFVAEDAAPAAVYMPVLLVLLFPMNFSRGSLPEINTEMAAQMEIVEQVLREDAADAGSDPWNSTLPTPTTTAYSTLPLRRAGRHGY